MRNLRKSIPFCSPRVPYSVLLGFHFRPENPESVTRGEPTMTGGFGRKDILRSRPAQLQTALLSKLPSFVASGFAKHAAVGPIAGDLQSKLPLDSRRLRSQSRRFRPHVTSNRRKGFSTNRSREWRRPDTSQKAQAKARKEKGCGHYSAAPVASTNNEKSG